MSDAFVELNPDQSKELINTEQRFQAFREVEARWRDHRGSMVWHLINGTEYLIRAAYDKQGRRKQTSLGPRSSDTERIKAQFEDSRDQITERYDSMRAALTRQAAVNRALRLGRVPHLSARIIRALDDRGLLGSGLRVLGTHAIYAYEAAAGVIVDPGITTTDDVDFLLDSRHRLSFVALDEVDEASLLRVLQRLDASFARQNQTFRAANKSGFLVDLIRPMRNPPWNKDRDRIGDDQDDLSAVEIGGLSWHESASPFAATAVDERGEPVRIVTSDPRVFAAHKYWISNRTDRDPRKRGRDRQQAEVVARLVARYFQHLPLEAGELRMLPLDLVEEVRPLFHPG